MAGCHPGRGSHNLAPSCYDRCQLLCTSRSGVRCICPFQSPLASVALYQAADSKLTCSRTTWEPRAGLPAHGAAHSQGLANVTNVVGRASRQAVMLGTCHAFVWECFSLCLLSNRGFSISRLSKCCFPPCIFPMCFRPGSTQTQKGLAAGDRFVSNFWPCRRPSELGALILRTFVCSTRSIAKPGVNHYTGHDLAPSVAKTSRRKSHRATQFPLAMFLRKTSVCTLRIGSLPARVKRESRLPRRRRHAQAARRDCQVRAEA